MCKRDRNHTLRMMYDVGGVRRVDSEGVEGGRVSRSSKRTPPVSSQRVRTFSYIRDGVIVTR